MGFDVSTIDGLDLQRKKYFYDKLVNAGVALPKDFATQDFETLYFRCLNEGRIQEFIPPPTVIPEPPKMVGITADITHFGAKGDGVFNNSPAMQSAVDFLATVGGGTLVIPNGDFYTSEEVYLVSNLEIVGSKNTIIRKTAASRGYAVFAAGSNGPGYENGVSNVTMRGITFRGKFGVGGRGLCAIAGHHAQDILVYDCNFIECSRGGHRFDLQGCRRVTFRDNVFQGLDTSMETSGYYNEDIQLDNSTKGGLSFPERNPSDLLYDGLPCSDIIITNNRWLELKIGNTTYPSANPVGTHAAVEDYYQKRIWITDNYFGPGNFDNGYAFVTGRIHFFSWMDAVIRGNVFDGGGVESAAIMVYPTKNSFKLADLSRTDNSSTPLPVALTCENITVSQNTFKNFKSTNASAMGIIHINAGGTSSPVYHKNVTVTDNTFIDNKTLPVSTNDSQNLIWLSFVEGFEVSLNTCRTQRRAIWIAACRNGTVATNNVKDSSNTVIGIDGSYDVQVSNNEIYGATGTPALVVSGGDFVRTTGNTIRSTTAASTAIRYTGGTTNGIVTDNLVRGVGVIVDQGVHVTASTILKVCKNNIFSSVKNATLADGTSSITVNTGNEILV